jgi:hypothetical protein
LETIQRQQLRSDLEFKQAVAARRGPSREGGYNVKTGERSKKSFLLECSLVFRKIFSVGCPNFPKTQVVFEAKVEENTAEHQKKESPKWEKVLLKTGDSKAQNRRKYHSYFPKAGGDTLYPPPARAATGPIINRPSPTSNEKETVRFVVMSHNNTYFFSLPSPPFQFEIKCVFFSKIQFEIK